MSLVNDALRKTRRSSDSQSGTAGAAGHSLIEPSIAPRGRRHAVAITIIAAGGFATGAVVLFIWLFAGDRGGPRQAGAAVGPGLPQVLVAAAETKAPSTSAPPPQPEPVVPPKVPAPAPTAAVETPAPVAPPTDTVLPPQPPKVAAPQPTVAAAPRSPSGIDPQAVYVSTINIPGATTIKLDAIIWSAENPVALINGTALMPNSVLGNVRVTAIESRRVTLEHAGVSFYLRLP